MIFTLLLGSVFTYQSTFTPPDTVMAVGTITSLSPEQGTEFGGTHVVIQGNGFMKQAVWKQLAPSSYHTCALAEDNWVYCWGGNWGGQLGNGTEDDSLVPVAISQGDIPADATILTVSSGTEFSCAIASDNKAYCWGWGDSGQIGNGETVNVSVPKAVAQGEMPSEATVKDITTGMVTACAIASDNKAYCWGWGGYGALGNNGTADSSVPVAVSQGSMPVDATVKQISIGIQHGCLIGSDNKAYCWGSGVQGELGNGTNGAGAGSYTPVTVLQGDVPATDALKQVSVDGAQTCAVSSGDKAYCWGQNNFGQTGDGTLVGKSVPTAVLHGAIPPSETIKYISSGDGRSCAVASNEQIYCWGLNGLGALGDGTTTNSSVPVAVLTGGASAIPAGTTFSSIESVYYGSCALSTAGQIYCWGYNSSGQLGNGVTAYSQITPVLVNSTLLPDIPNVTAVYFGGAASPDFSVDSDTQLTATTPPHVPGSVAVGITDLYGDSTVYDGYSYSRLAPTVDAIHSVQAGHELPAITGNVGDAGAVVVVTVSNKSFTATNNGDGTWVLAAGAIESLAEGTYTVTVTATDSNGSSETSTTTLRIIGNSTSSGSLAPTGLNLSVMLGVATVSFAIGALLLRVSRRKIMDFS
jgi:alpha-tubulin suppressor-like RCC1 family protein